MVSLQPSVLPPHPVLNTLCPLCLCCPAAFCLCLYWQRCVSPSTNEKTGSLPPFPSLPFLSFPSLFINLPGGLLWGETDHRSFLKRHLLRPSAHSHAGKHPRIHLKTTENPNYSPLSVFLINNSIYLVSSLWRWKITLTCKASSYWCWCLDTTAPGFIILHSSSFTLQRTEAAR